MTGTSGEGPPLNAAVKAAASSKASIHGIAIATIAPVDKPLDFGDITGVAIVLFSVVPGTVVVVETGVIVEVRVVVEVG